MDGHEWKRSERIRSAWRVKELLAGSEQSLGRVEAAVENSY